MFGGFGDVSIDPAANAAMRAFLRRKLTETVRDPATAAALTPREDEHDEQHPPDYYARRPLCDRGYYEAFNRPHVSAVDLRATPITAVEAGGVRTADGRLHELDVLVLATGYDAVDGAYRAVRGGITGRDGRGLAERWTAAAANDNDDDDDSDNGGRPSAYLGVFVPGFPNLFLLNGPQSPFATAPLVLETQADFVVSVIGELEAQGHGAVEARPEPEAEWVQGCDAIASYTLFSKVTSWLTGSNISGKPRTMFYLAGLSAYIQQLEELKSNGYATLQFS
jgi:cyclohexanone monooxygenase